MTVQPSSAQPPAARPSTTVTSTATLGTATPGAPEPRCMAIVATYTSENGRPLPLPDPPAPEYADVAAALEGLRTTVGNLITADDVQAQTVVSSLGRLFPALLPMVMPHLTEAGTAVKQTLAKALADVERVATERLGPHAEIPARLEAERDLGRKQGEAITALVTRVTELAKTEGWEGEAAEGYRRAAVVQANALEELAGVHVSAANALDREALLNRAAFFYATEAIRFTSAQLDVAPPGDSMQLFRRTRSAEGHLHSLAAKLQSELDAIGTGETVQELAQELGALLETPAVLQPTGWPTGGTAADAKPAPTSGVVRAVD